MRSAQTSSAKIDEDREISQKGKTTINDLAECLDKKDLKDVSEIRHSKLIRARQTAELFNNDAGLKAKLKEAPLLEPNADFRILADIVNKCEKDLILVGHQPNLGLLASYLLTQDCKWDVFIIKKTGLLCLEKTEGPEIQKGWKSAWQLRWLLSPRLFKKR